MNNPTLSASTGASYARILGTGSVRGDRVVTNEEMCTMIDSTPEWIEQRTGIRERRWATPEQTVIAMASQAARQAIEDAGLTPDQIDTVIIASVSHHRPSPSLATDVAREIGATSAAALDINAACAGFCYATTLSESLIRSGASTHVVSIGVERLSDMINMKDRSTAFLFSDGAGAAVFGPSEEPAIAPTQWGSRADQVEVIEIEDWTQAASHPDVNYPLIAMEGRKVFKWALTEVAAKAKEAIAAAGITADDLDVFIPHQANDRIVDVIVRHLGLPDSVTVCHDIAGMGNTSAASIPIAMDRMRRRGDAHSGDLALIIGFGAGLVYAGQVVRLP
ncbi:MAG: beta-ketoacyl-ACP synthase III [Cutibacterium granulosum]|nr:beta-ketoacyl-ACP synthase III [Cutibacterium granulosum]